MNKYEKIYVKAAKRGGSPNWVDTAVMALAVDIEEATGLPVNVRGPYGLRAEVSLEVGYDEKRKTGKTLVLTARFTLGPEDIFHLFYDTGKCLNKHPTGSLAAVNGFNNDTAPLPDELPEILKLLRDIFPDEIRGVLVQPNFGLSEIYVAKETFDPEVADAIHANALQVTYEGDGNRFAIFFDENIWKDCEILEFFNTPYILGSAPAVFICGWGNNNFVSLHDHEINKLMQRFR